MLWAFQQLKGMYLNHVTCIAHGLRHICESTRENYNSVNDFIAALKKILIKAPSRQVLYQEVTGLHFPQFPIKCLRLNRCSSHQAGPTISQQQRPRVPCMVCIVLKGWSLLPNALRPFQIYCAHPNLGIRTWICWLNVGRGLFFQAWGSLTNLKSQTRNPQLKVPLGGLVLRIFTSWKNPSDLSRVWTREPWISKRARYPENTLPNVIQSFE